MAAQRSSRKADEDARRQRERDAAEQAKQELGSFSQLVDIGRAGTFEGLLEELDVKDRLNGAINRCLKQLLVVRGIKSLSLNSLSAAKPQNAGWKKSPSALKHGGYSAIGLLPEENGTAFRKLQRNAIADLRPAGALEEEMVAEIARLIWRKLNLATCWVAKLATDLFDHLKREKNPFSEMMVVSVGTRNKVVVKTYRRTAQEEEERAKQEAAVRSRREAKEDARRQREREVEEQARQELGDLWRLVNIGKAATIEGLMEELDVQERLDSAINKCLKQLITVRGIKSLSSNSLPAATPQIAGPRKAGDDVQNLSHK
jgi:hypothetical protein